MDDRPVEPEPGRMRVGLVLPVVSDVVTFSQQAERLGFDYLGVAEHVTFRGPVPNAFVWLAAAAGATSRIRLVSTIALIPLYPPALFAKLVASVDYLSGGRLELGVGVGGEYRIQFQAEGLAVPSEDPAAGHFRAAGVAIDERSERGDESLEILTRLLGSREPVEFEGEWTSFASLEVSPKREEGRPPIWIGGRLESAIRRAARYADVYMASNATVAEVVEARDAVKALADEYGRSGDNIATAVYLFLIISDDKAEGRRRAVSYIADLYHQDFGSRVDKFVIGNPNEVLARMTEYVDAGVTLFMIELVCDAAEYPEQMQRLAREVVPHLARPTVRVGRDDMRAAPTNEPAGYEREKTRSQEEAP